MGVGRESQIRVLAWVLSGDIPGTEVLREEGVG